MKVKNDKIIFLAISINGYVCNEEYTLRPDSSSNSFKMSKPKQPRGRFWFAIHKHEGN